MVASQKKQVLNLYFNGLLIGELSKYRDGRLQFQYATNWIATPAARPISLSLPLREQSYTGDIVYNYFDNLLPDNTDIRARIQSLFNISSSHPFDILAKIGKDCIGAIELSAGESCFAKKIEYKKLNKKTIRDLINNYKANPLGMGLSESQSDFRISLAGAQEKFGLLKQKNAWCLPLNSTATTHIFKLPIGIIHHNQIDLSNSCENEWLCLEISKAFGIPTAESYIYNIDGQSRALVVERFDRKLSQDKNWIVRLPQEELCQAMGYSPNLKYEADGGPGIPAIIDLLRGSCQALEDQEIFIKSQILFYLLAAIDGHAKNFSIFLQAANTYRLAPLYDIISAHPLLNRKQLQQKKIKMAMGLYGQKKHYRWHDIQEKYFYETASKSNYSVKQTKISLESMLSQLDEVINVVSKKIPSNFPELIAESIFSGMLKARNNLC